MCASIRTRRSRRCRCRCPTREAGELVALDAAAIRDMPDERLQQLMVKLFRPGTINIQKYLANQGGYPYWHCELYPKIGDSHGETLHRVLLWSVYLNDAFAEGETEFLHQQRKVVPQTGSLLIAPAGFTHTHRGNMPQAAATSTSRPPGCCSSALKSCSRQPGTRR